LKSPPAGVRPTSDRVRGALFNALEARNAKLDSVLDVYAGSGALGIEALSRGAGRCDFIERGRATASVIRENLSSTGMTERGRVVQARLESALERLHGPYTLVFADPPYDDASALPALGRLADSDLVGSDTTLVLEHSSRQDAPERLGRLMLDWSRRYGDTQISMYQEDGS
jgi:16S rRNA (guanine966-N2)-methyltransferase